VSQSVSRGLIFCMMATQCNNQLSNKYIVATLPIYGHIYGCNDSAWAFFSREPRTEPNRNQTEISVFRFFGSVSVSDSGNFGGRLGVRFVPLTEPRTDWNRSRCTTTEVRCACVPVRISSLPQRPSPPQPQPTDSTTLHFDPHAKPYPILRSRSSGA
jgi:hypothetical protein